MMKQSAFLVISGVLLGTPAIAGETPAAQPIALEAEAQHTAYTEGIIANVKEMTETLKGVTDTATADAAAPKARELVKRNRDLVQRSKSLPLLSPATTAERRMLFVVQAKPLMADLRAEVARVLGNQCYNSDAMLQALAPLIHK